MSHHNWSDALLFQRHFAMNNGVKLDLKEHTYYHKWQCYSMHALSRDTFSVIKILKTQWKIKRFMKQSAAPSVKLFSWGTLIETPCFWKNFIQLWHKYHYYHRISPAQWNSYTCLLYFPIEKRKWLILTILAASSPNQIRIIAVTRVCFVSSLWLPIPDIMEFQLQVHIQN